MGKSVLVFISHASEDKEAYIEPIVSDLENCYINVWIDKRKLVPGENLRKSILRDGLDKADVALIFFTQNSLQSSWVNREINHVLREETKKGKEFDMRKIISVFDSKETYKAIAERYPELTDDLLHLMPLDYDKVKLGQLVSAIWSKYLDLQGGDVETQRQLLAKDKEIFQKTKENAELENALKEEKSKSKSFSQEAEFEQFFQSNKLKQFIQNKDLLLQRSDEARAQNCNGAVAAAFGLAEIHDIFITLTEKGHDFFRWYILVKEK